jgi:DNA-binding winged helix-turn-helix (wHTH) protein/Tfp pilus assembly protein PilF
MDAPVLSVGILRFGVFEADLRSGELRKNGARVKIQELPFRALRLLLSRPNEVVSREDLRRALWPDDVFVDFDHGISSAINRLRDALGDAAENPIFVETVERRGYRWIAPVHGPEMATRTPNIAPAKPTSVIVQEVSPTSADAAATFLQFGRKLVWAIPVAALLFAAWTFRPGARAVKAGEPRVSALTSSSLPVSSRTAATAEAEDFYLKGRFYWNKRTPDGLTKAVDYFTQAIVHDPGYAKAYVGLADCYNLLREYTLMPAAEAYPRALAAARRAVELDDHSSEAHASLAFASFWGNWDSATADREFRRAIELDPRNAIAHHWYATYLLTAGRPEEALAEIDRARALDPSNSAILADKGDILLSVGKTNEGVTLLQQMETTDPTFISPHRYLKNAYLERGDNASFIAEAREEATLMKDPVGLGIANAAQQGLASGGTQGMLRGIRTTEKKYFEEDKLSPFALAEVCARMGDQDEALHYLQIALDRHDQSIPAVPGDAAFNTLHDRSDYQSLIAHAHLGTHP